MGSLRYREENICNYKELYTKSITEGSKDTENGASEEQSRATSN
jgi:hypothetical protein